jgi:phospholipid/cholesterol/gamma-HCH transport system permease protein
MNETIGLGKMIPNTPEQAAIKLSRITEDTLLITLIGNWQIGQKFPALDEIHQQIEAQGPISRIAFDSTAVESWDSSILMFLGRVLKAFAHEELQVEKEGLPTGVQKLIGLATAVPRKEDAQKTVPREAFMTRVGSDFIAFVNSAGELIAFVGASFMTTVRLITGKARFRSSDLGLFLQDAGARAVPIVSLISFLVGLILAFVAVVQLEMFGAQIYVANLVGVAMVRALGAIMTGIIMAGRTGASFAAQLGTMQVNEEIDALQTLGIDPMEYLVLPRMLALTLMMPLLCLYADLLGILGGWVVCVPLYGLNSSLYFSNTMAAVGLNDLFIGLFESLVFGILVALSGCMRGMQCGRSASEVGDAATSAVVTSIVAIIIATAVITVVCDVLGI